MRNKDIEDLPLRESTSRRRNHGWDAKRHDKYDEHWKPAKRWLNDQIGRNWDDVWADICAAPKHDYKLHYLRENVGYHVITNCFVKCGKIYTIYGSMEYEVGTSQYRPHELYVHPETRLLCKPVHKPKPKPPKPTKIITLNKLTYHQKNGIWYCINLVRMGSRTWYLSDYDSLYKKNIGLNEAHRYYGKTVFCKSHRPVNSKELRSIKKFLKDIKDAGST